MKRRSRTTVVEKIIHSAIGEMTMYPDASNRLKSDKRKPGEAILRLSDEDREVLKTCTSKDFNHRVFE